ncbi:hypothetical protein GCM10020258_33360 [Sphingomonas yabuuchiae]
MVGRQRGLLADTLGKPAAQVPQLYVAYHELQEAYDAGLTLPGDVTLMWTDDNYGYLRRLSTPEEQKRPGGAGSIITCPIGGGRTTICGWARRTRR